MKFENTGIENVTADLERLEDVMKTHGLIKAGQWDYERVTFDRKFIIKEGTFYLRIQGLAVEGDIGADHASIKLMTPLLGKHYYPHGVEYGDGEHFPAHLVDTCEKIIKQVMEEVQHFAH
ncbi:hypothetical protein Q73_04935 [Bacillus coahuilensis m2-6]|uniref:YugN family protein n=1 Tax=Bacillus coahuilensis TaxID=408580 RepID=UPI00018514F3|nr:YugN family protein [Bacillus coahuilensis]KUP08542.1 hypothetical protein Q73_04935 [Bacillus coahuilensis m2-6]